MSTGAMAGLMQNLEGTRLMQAADDHDLSEVGGDGTSEEVDDFAALLAVLTSSEEGEEAGLIEMLMGENEEIDLSEQEAHLSLIMLLTSSEIRETPEGEELLSRLQSGQSPTEILAGADESLLKQLMEELEALISRENLDRLEADLAEINRLGKGNSPDHIPKEMLQEMEMEGLTEERTERIKLLLEDLFDSGAAEVSELDRVGSNSQEMSSRLHGLLGDSAESNSKTAAEMSSEQIQIDLEMLGEKFDLDSSEIKSLIEQIQRNLAGEVEFLSEGENLNKDAELTGEAYRIWSELAAGDGAETAAKDMELGELFQSLSPQNEEISLQESLDLEKLVSSGTGDWQDMISGLPGENAETMTEFGESFSWQEFLDGFTDPEEEAMLNTGQPASEESAVDLENLMISKLQSDSSTAEMNGRQSQVTSFEKLEVMEQITDSIEFMEQQGENTLELELEPEFLGRVNLNVTVENGGVIAHMMVENNTVRRELEGNLHMLQRNLSREGLDVERITVESRGGEDNLQNHNENSGHRQGESGNGGSGTGGQFQEQFQPVMAHSATGIDEDLAGIDGELRRWLMWKQYQHDWV